MTDGPRIPFDDSLPRPGDGLAAPGNPGVRAVFDPDVPFRPGAGATLPDLVEESVFHRNWALLTRLARDRASIETWDRTLDRARRIFVPIDVQAFVVPDTDPEPTVPVTGGPGDPAPFAAGSPRPPGVHLHWALPDALLRGSAAPDADDLDFPELPDRWVVVRVLYPDGRSQPLLRGWVVDSAQGSVTPMATYSGTPRANDDVPSFERVDGAVGGSLHWTAVYEASAGRFGFHDPLTDDHLTRQRFDRATYVVAGWASTVERDPLGATRTDKVDLFDLLDRLRWSATEVPAGEYSDPKRALLRWQDTDITPVPGTGTSFDIRLPDGAQHVEAAGLQGLTRAPDVDAGNLVVTADPPAYASLLHGFVAGVPVDGSVAGRPDGRPAASALDLALGLDLNDVVAAWFTDSWTLSGDRRRGVEVLTSAFTTNLLSRLTAPDGLREIEEHDHGSAFWSFAGPRLPTSRDDRLVNTDASAANPLVMGRKGRAARRRRDSRAPTTSTTDSKVTLIWSDEVKPVIDLRREERRAKREAATRTAPDQPAAESRTVPKPGPRYHRPVAPTLAVRGCRPSLRYLGDGMYSDDGCLKVRYPSQVRDRIRDVLSGAELVPSLGSGAVPGDVLTALREAVLIDPYASAWRAEIVARKGGSTDELRTAAKRRMDAESLLLFGPDGRYTGNASGALDAIRGDSGAGGWRETIRERRERIREAGEISRWSFGNGQPPSPVGVTSWSQPWVPLWAEWEVELTGSTSIEGWRLDDLDLEADPETEPAESARLGATYTGRSPLGRGALTALHAAIGKWRTEQIQRSGSLGSRYRRDLADLERFLQPLDMASASLDGIREQLLGIDYVGGLSSGPGEDDRPRADGPAHPLFGGRVALRRLRLVDAFGRTLDVPFEGVDTTTKLHVADDPAAIAVRPRLQHGSRLLLRLVDPAHGGDGAQAPEAFVDQVDAARAVNPVVGYLLPDHIDEALEFFDVAGTAIGQLGHHELTGAVRWEPAPGRPLAPGAGPLARLDNHTVIAGQIASGVVQSDIGSRSDVEHDPDGGTGDPGVDSSLTALLRAIDTTMWTIDTSTTGTGSVAGLVGRPIAVVRAVLRLEAPGDLDEVRTPSPEAAQARAAAFARLTDQRFPVRLGDLQRSDDSLLGYFVDDDYSRFHLVDARLVAQARDGGRYRGQLGLLGHVAIPPSQVLDHPYVSGDDVLLVRPGRTYRLTLLMLPAGKVHATSGILPRKSIQLHSEWTEPGVTRLVPSVRVGPVLVDSGEIRLPEITLLGERQQFIRRTGPLTWREDPILAASQSALLPRLPHELQEGWVRVVEEPGDE